MRQAIRYDSISRNVETIRYDSIFRHVETIRYDAINGPGDTIRYDQILPTARRYDTIRNADDIRLMPIGIEILRAMDMDWGSGGWSPPGFEGVLRPHAGPGPI